MAATLASCWTIGDVAHSLWAHVFGPGEAGRDELEERIGVVDPWRKPIRGAKIIDRRHETRSMRNWRGRPRQPISWEHRCGATVHQTGEGVLHPDHPGVLSIPAHILIHRPHPGGVVPVTLLHPLTIRMPHGHRLNSETWGVEVDCREWGILRNRHTFPMKKREKAAGMRAEDVEIPVDMRQLVVLGRILERGAEVHAMHSRPFSVFTHRQGDDSRGADPGERIARYVDSLRRRHGWPDTRNETRGTGKPWPAVWRSAP